MVCGTPSSLETWGVCVYTGEPETWSVTSLTISVSLVAPYWFTTGLRLLLCRMLMLWSHCLRVVLHCEFKDDSNLWKILEQQVIFDSILVIDRVFSSRCTNTINCYLIFFLFLAKKHKNKMKNFSYPAPPTFIWNGLVQLSTWVEGNLVWFGELPKLNVWSLEAKQTKNSGIWPNNLVHPVIFLVITAFIFHPNCLRSMPQRWDSFMAYDSAGWLQVYSRVGCILAEFGSWRVEQHKAGRSRRSERAC